MTDLAIDLWPDDWENTPIVESEEFDDPWVSNVVSLAFSQKDEDQLVTFKWEPLPHQIAPDWAWDLWMILGGRGAGKTDGGAVETNKHMMGPPCDPRLPGGHRGAIIAPTLGDASLSCVEGVSGLKVHNPEVYSVTQKGGTFVVWPNGARAKLFGAYGPGDVERLRAGGNNCFFWAEELAAWPQLRKVWDQLQFGLRLGEHPRGIATTTPKPRKVLKELLADETTAITTATTEDNPFLPKRTRAKLKKRYSGTRLGKQELQGKILEDVPGAVATDDQIQACRVESLPGKLSRKIAVVDPATTNTETSDKAGIAIGGIKSDHVYQEADLSMKGEVNEWCDELVAGAYRYDCPEIWYESPGGSDTFKLVIQAAVDRHNAKLKRAWQSTYEQLTVDDRPPVPKFVPRIKPVPANMSKRDRAVALEMAIQQETWHPVGVLEELEEQLTTWVAGESDDDEEEDAVKTGQKKKMDSPNNMDAGVHLYRILTGQSHGRGRTSGSSYQ